MSEEEEMELRAMLKRMSVEDKLRIIEVIAEMQSFGAASPADHEAAP